MAAYAYWTAGGSGSGSAATGTTVPITVNQTGSVTGLYPGATPTALSGTFTNTNSGAVHVSTVTAAVHTFSSQTDLTKPACTQADFAIGGSSSPNTDVPAGTGVGAWSGLTIQLVNSATNQDNCKSLSSVQIDYSAT